MKTLVKTQQKTIARTKNATTSTVKRAGITTQKNLLLNQKRAINAKLSSGNAMNSKEKKKLTKKSAKRDKQLASLTKKEDSMTAKEQKRQDKLARTAAKLKERKELAGISNIKENMTPEQKQESEQREKNFTNLVESRKAAAGKEKLRKQGVRDNRLSKEITRKTEQLNKLTKKKAKQDAKEANRNKTGKKLGFFEKMFNGFRKKVGKSNIKSKETEITNLSSKIGKNSKPFVERIKSGAKKFKNFFTLKSTLERRKKEAEEVERALQESQA